MYYKFLNYIEQNQLFLPDRKILLAVSGGRDSMVMTDLFIKAGFKFGVAHFNHSTRSGESDLDESFVRDFCEKNNIVFYSTKMDIEEFMNRGEGNNFQDIARKYRYQWLEEIRKEEGYDYIATAHHKDDNIETFLYKISRGSGLSGLKGINMKIGKIIRPMLNISRDEIDVYTRENKIEFREDSSNISDKYSRNFIRHHIIPQFQKLNQNFDSRISVTMRNLQSAGNALNFLIDDFFKNHISYDNDIVIIQKDILIKNIDNKDVIYYLLSKYDFNISQIEDILMALDNTGAMFFSENFELLIDRNEILIRERRNDDNLELTIKLGSNEINRIGVLKIEKIAMQKDLDLKNGLYLNADDLVFPLKLRKWQPGDKFKPFGLKGKSKKLKDFFTDKKLSRFEKDKVFVLLNKDEICTVIPLEISYDYKIADNTKEVIRIELVK